MVASAAEKGEAMEPAIGITDDAGSSERLTGFSESYAARAF
jgi:hypothetical protein